MTKSLFNRKRYFVAVGFGVISMKSLFYTSCNKDLIDFRQFWLLKETFWQNSYRIFTFWYRYTLFPIRKVSLRTSPKTSERNEMCDFTDFVSEERVTIPESKDTIAVLSKSVFKRSKMPKINEIFITTCVKETFHWNYTKSYCNKVSFAVKGTFRKITKSSLLLVLPIKQTFDQNYTCSCVMKLCLTTTNGILETPIRTF